jgi:signal transduction histidine kinase
VIDDRVRLHVADNGVGIARAEQEKIFRMFERLRPTQFPGTGLGLAIARRAVQKCGGDIGFKSEAGQGSTFWIEVPGYSPPPEKIITERWTNSHATADRIYSATTINR